MSFLTGISSAFEAPHKLAVAALMLVVPAFAHAQLYSENFEGGVLPAGWTVPAGADGGWSITNVTAHNSTFSLQSDSIPNNSTAEIKLTITTPFARVNFWHYWNDQFASPLVVFVNGVQVYSANFPRGWYPSAPFDLPEGTNEIVFVQQRNPPGQGLTGCKCSRIDDITIVSLDVDLDSMQDEWELDNGFNPADPLDAALDADTDGLTNLEEFQNGTDPNNPDTDSDGVDDVDEVNTYGTNPLSADTDSDQLPDGWEIDNALDPLDSGDAWIDTDGDGLQNIGEFRLGYDPQNPASVPPLTLSLTEDFETGTIPAVWDTPTEATAGWSITSITARNSVYSIQSDNIDHNESASIRVPLFIEASELRFWHFWNAENNDRLRVYVNGSQKYSTPNNTPRGWYPAPVIDLPAGYVELVFEYDKNGFTNGACDCVRIDDIAIITKDVDQDGMLDQWEIDNGLNPADPGDAAVDNEPDGLTNLAEFLNGTDPNVADSDGDGLTDGEEINTYGTDALNSDSDSDNMPDGWEVDNGLDPLDSLDADMDADGDGLQNIGEFRLGYDPQDAGSVPPLMLSYSQDFESGTVPAEWQTPGSADAGWSVTSVTAHTSVYSLQSDTISTEQNAQVTLALFTPLSSFNFWHYWNADFGDPLQVFVNNELVYETPTTVPRGWYPPPTIQLSPGYNEIVFSIERERFGGSYGCNCVRIDDINIVSIDDDLDGMANQWETDNGLNPLDAADALLDGDSDGLNNLGEFNAGTNPNVPDTDGDGLNDGAEVNTYLTNPLSGDTDGDEMPDAWEVNNSLDPLDAADALLDADGDNLPNRGEYRFNRNPQNPSSTVFQYSNLLQFFESGNVSSLWYTPAGSNGTWAIESNEVISGNYSLRGGSTVPYDKIRIAFPVYVTDTELRLSYRKYAGGPAYFRIIVDGVYQFQSNTIHYNGFVEAPVIPLTAGYHEIEFEFDKGYLVSSLGCSCAYIDNITITKADGDADLLPDWWELRNGYSPLNPADAAADSDGDGLDTLGEYMSGTDPQDPDSDDDGLTDGDEVNVYGTNALDDDSDYDRMPDGWEVDNGLNPLLNDWAGDADGDGLNNRGEYELGYDPQDPLSVPPLTITYTQDFEAGTVPPEFFVPDDADAGWFNTNITAHTGARSLQSENIVNSGDIAIATLGLFIEESELQFWYYWNSANNDPFRVYVNGQQVLYAGLGTPRGWYPSPVIDLPSGWVEIEFQYINNAGANMACRCVRIDDIQIITKDVDRDGMLDQWEIDNGLNPSDPFDGVLDLDGDGLLNVDEFNEGADPNDTDSDGDALLDGYEFNTLGTSPVNADTDGDQMDDGYEVAESFDPLDPADAWLDLDGDGLVNLGEFKLGYDPNDAGSIAPLTNALFEGFEGGVLPAGPTWFIPPATDPWNITSVTARNSVYSLQSAASNGDTAEVKLQMYTPAGLLNFWHYWNANADDPLIVSVNGVIAYQTNPSTPRGWYPSPVLPLAAGYNEVTFSFTRTGSYGCNCVRIDNVAFNAN